MIFRDICVMRLQSRSSWYMFSLMAVAWNRIMKENNIFVDCGLYWCYFWTGKCPPITHTHRISTDYKSEQFVNESRDMIILHYNVVTLCWCTLYISRSIIISVLGIAHRMASNGYPWTRQHTNQIFCYLHTWRQPYNYVHKPTIQLLGPASPNNTQIKFDRRKFPCPTHMVRFSYL